MGRGGTQEQSKEFQSFVYVNKDKPLSRTGNASPTRQDNLYISTTNLTS